MSCLDQSSVNLHSICSYIIHVDNILILEQVTREVRKVLIFIISTGFYRILSINEFTRADRDIDFAINAMKGNNEITN